MYNFNNNPDFPIIDTAISELWSLEDDLSCQQRDTDTEEELEIHHLRYKEGA